MRDDEKERVVVMQTRGFPSGIPGYTKERGPEKIKRNIAMLEEDAARHGHTTMHDAYLADCYFGAAGLCTCFFPFSRKVLAK